MKIPERTIQSVEDFVEQIGDWSAPEAKHKHLRMWFRGHSDASWDLTPGIFREGVLPNHLDTERHTFRDFKLWSAGIILQGTLLEDLYFQQQHHGVPTRLLDWTTNALIALYFAVEEKADTAAAVFAMDAYQFQEFDGFATVDHPVLKDALAEIVGWQNGITQPNFIFPVRPAFTDLRMQIQRSGFTYHPPTHPTLTAVHNPNLRKLIIPSDKRKSMKEQLNHMGIDHFSVYGDLDALAKTLRNNYAI